MAATVRKKAPAKRPVKRQVKRKRPTGQRRTSTRQTAAPSFLLPFFLSFCMLVCLGALGYLGYQSVTASQFFDVAAVQINGASRTSKGDIERIVTVNTEKSGVWNADLDEIRAKIEKLPFVKSSAVSRVLPNGIIVSLNEKVPQAVVRLNSVDFLADEQGEIIAPASGPEEALPFAMIGWDETKSEKAGKENAARVKTYQKMLSDWRQFDLASRIKSVDLTDLREPRAVTEDSGATVTIALGRENFGEHLKRGINAIVGKGETFEAVNLVGSNMILAPRKAK